MKNIFKLLIACWFLLYGSTAAFADLEITGSPSPLGVLELGDFFVYYNGTTVTNPKWTVSSGQTLFPNNFSDHSYVGISFSALGTYTIRFYDGTTLLASKTIQVVCVVPPYVTMSGTICGNVGSVTITAMPGAGANSVRWYTQSSGGTSFSSSNTITVSTSVTYYVMSYASSSCQSTRVPVTVTALPGVTAPGTTTTLTLCQGPVKLQATVGAGGDLVRWSGGSGNDKQEGNDYLIENLTSNKTFTVYSYNTTTGCASDTVTVSASVRPAVNPVVNAYSTTVRGHGQVQLKANMGQQSENDSDKIRWYTTEKAGAYEGEVWMLDAYTTPDLFEPVTYYAARVEATYGCESPTRVSVIAGILPLTSTNQMREDNVRISGVTTDAQIDGLADAQKTSTVYHYDGLGRVNQQIGVKASPLGYDIVQPVEFDNKGRVSKNYLPYVAQNQANNGSFQSNYKTDQETFYTTPPTGVQGDATPYAVSLYEQSPLGRALEQGRAGATFQPGTGHTLRSAYSFNVANEVRKFNTDGTSSQFYDANKLDKITITDPNGHISIQYTNAEGQVILARRQWDETVNGTTIDYLDTYYIYDDLGRIKYIIPPKGVATMKTTSWAFSQDILNGYTYQFIYDDLGRVIEKKVPGQAWQYLAYDRLDRLVLVQDGLMRAQNKWSYFKYDQQGRIIVQGWYTNTTYTTRNDIQTNVLDPLYANATDTWYESAGTALQGYTNNSFPTTNAAVQIVNYFDSYDLDRNGSDDFNYEVQNLANENTPGPATGMPTATKRLIAGTNTWLTTYAFFDEYGRVIQTRSNNHLSSAVDNLTTNVYDFEGKLLFSKTTHKGGVGKETTITQRQEYDDVGRIKNIYRPVATPQPVQWTNLVNAAASGNTIRKTTTTTGWDAGGFSVNHLNAGQDGWVEFQVNSTTTGRMIGFSDQDGGTNYTTIDYALYPSSVNATLQVYENGTARGPFGTYAAGDFFSVERKNGVVYYKKNNQVFYTSTIPSTGVVYVDCSLYNANARALDVKLFAPVETIVAHYDYNELGQLIDKKLHKNAATGKYLQSIDYRYGLAGELTSINNATLNASPDGDGDAEQGDYFGFELLYEKTEGSLGNSSLYNGNISAIKWKGPGVAAGSQNQRSYKFAYDKIDQLKIATYQASSASAWDKENNAENESINYDPNGNILSLQRNQRTYQMIGTTASYKSGAIDNLSYTYDNILGDQLKKVDDGTTLARGFADGANETQEYAYDVNGNVISDKNKGISSITYSLLGKPTLVSFTDGRKVEYVYDAAGTKLTMRTYDAGSGTAKLTTDYVNEFVYENGALSFFGSPEGRVAIKRSALEYQYNITDHQGNTRVLFTSATTIADAPIAKFEGDDSDGIDSYEGIDVNRVVNFPGAANSGTHVIQMNQAYKVGPARSIAVFPGDKVDAEVWEYHEGSSGWGTTSAPINTLITAIAGTFGGVAGAPGESGAIYNGVNSAVGMFSTGGSQGDNSPGAYLNYILFDKDYNVLDMGWKPASQTPFSRQKLEFNTLNITEPGYVYIYLSYEGESDQFVYFDDLKVTHTPTNVIQYNEYYPYGLQASASWTREGHKNAYLYNQGTELNGSTAWYETMFRGYDAALGRFMQVDPLAAIEHWKSPFAYAGNNPIVFNDPSGLLKATQAEFLSFIEIALQGSGGTWSDDAGQHFFSGPDEAESWANAYHQQMDNGGSGSIHPVYGIDIDYHGTTATIKGKVVGYRYVPPIVGIPQQEDPRNNKKRPGEDLITQYESNESEGWAYMLVGEALAENGIGGATIGGIRKTILNAGVVNNNEKTLNRTIDLASKLIKQVKLAAGKKTGKLLEVYLSVAGAAFILKGTMILNENETTLAPEIKEINPSYYNENIQRIFENRSDGAGATVDW